MRVPRCLRGCRLLGLAGLALAGSLLCYTAARADFTPATPSLAPSSAELARARESFQGGLLDAAAGRWPQAVLAFDEAYRYSGNPVALLNLATALRESGRDADARTCLVALRTRHGAQLDPETQAKSDVLYASLTAVIELRAIPAEAMVAVDGAAQSSGMLRFEVNPGLHRVEVRAPGRLPFHWQDVVAAGQTRALEYRAQPSIESQAQALPAAPAAERVDGAEPRKRRLPRWALGLIVGGAALGVAAAVAIPLALRDPSTEAPKGVDMTHELR
jgi:hypothetical protein